MEIGSLHEWEVSFQAAAELQKSLAQRVALKPLPERIRTVAGADMAILDGDLGVACVIVYSFPHLEPLERVWSVKPLHFKYVPGFLSFREGLAFLGAFQKLKIEPDVVIFDGQGIAHPRGLGIASHIGLWLDRPTIGCGKSLLCGKYDMPAEAAGSHSPLIFKDRQVGAALRTKEKTLPIFVSPGHLADVDSSLALVMKCLDGRRIPKPTREADAFVAHLKKEPAAA
jgi:deoxyribonuclease V